MTSASTGDARRHVHGPGSDAPIVWYEGSGTTDKRWLTADERGSIVAVTNSSGNTMAINSYDEYGIPASTNIGRFQYTGQAWLPEVGLYYYKARIYSPTLGRFMQTDPIGYADGINWYDYVGGDPVNRSDPTGLCQECREDEIEFGKSLRGMSADQMEAAINDRASTRGPILAAAVLPGLVGVRAVGAAFTSVAYRQASTRISAHIASNVNRNIKDGLLKAVRHEVAGGAKIGGKDHIAKAHNTLGWIKNQIKGIGNNQNLSASEKGALTRQLERLSKKLEDALKPKVD